MGEASQLAAAFLALAPFGPAGFLPGWDGSPLREPTLPSLLPLLFLDLSWREGQSHLPSALSRRPSRQSSSSTASNHARAETEPSFPLYLLEPLLLPLRRSIFVDFLEPPSPDQNLIDAFLDCRILPPNEPVPSCYSLQIFSPFPLQLHPSSSVPPLARQLAASFFLSLLSRA